MVRSRNSCSKTKRSFSSITLLVFHGMRLFYTQLPKVPAVSGMLPVYSVRDVPGPYPPASSPLPSTPPTPPPAARAAHPVFLVGAQHCCALLEGPIFLVYPELRGACPPWRATHHCPAWPPSHFVAPSPAAAILYRRKIG